MLAVSPGVCSRPDRAHVLLQPRALLLAPHLVALPADVQGGAARGTRRVLLQPRAQTRAANTDGLKLGWKGRTPSTGQEFKRLLLVEEVTTGKFTRCQHGVPADGAVVVVSRQLLGRSNREPARGRKSRSGVKGQIRNSIRLRPSLTWPPYC